MPARLITSFKRHSEANLQVRTRRVIVSLTGNARFPGPWPAPAPSLEQLTAAFDAYCAAHQASLTGDTLRIAERNAAREVVDDMLRKLGAYLEFAAHGDELALQSTGFELHREPVRIDRSVPPVAPERLRVQRGTMSGQLDVRFGRVPGAGSYEVQVAVGDPSVETNWRTVLTSTLCTGVLRDLLPLRDLLGAGARAGRAELRAVERAGRRGGAVDRRGEFSAHKLA
jgi:hypothetical protein